MRNPQSLTMAPVRGDGMRGLAVFISDIRNCEYCLLVKGADSILGHRNRVTNPSGHHRMIGSGRNMAYLLGGHSLRMVVNPHIRRERAINKVILVGCAGGHRRRRLLCDKKSEQY